MNTEQMLMAAIGALSTAIVVLYRKLQARQDQIIEMSMRYNNGFTEKLEKIMGIVNKFNNSQKDEKS